MSKVRCEIQNRAMFAAGTIFILAYILFQLKFFSLFGVNQLQVLIVFVLALCGLHSLFGAIKGWTVYFYDEDEVGYTLFGTRKSVRWAEISDIRIRRWSGDSQIRLSTAQGRKVWLDFQQMGINGGEFFDFLSAKIRPLIETKLKEMEGREVTFYNRVFGVIPMGPRISAGAGLIRGAGASAGLPLQEITEVKVKEIRRLNPTQEYTVRGKKNNIQFKSSYDDSPLLIKYLKLNVPEEKWLLSRSSNVIMAKLMTALMVIVLVFSTLVDLKLEADIIAAQRVQEQQAEKATGTVLDTRSLSKGFHEVSYTFKTAQGDEISGRTFVKGSARTLPENGSEVQVLFSRENPYQSRLMETATLKPLQGSILFFDDVLLFLLCLPYVLAVLFYKPRDDRFLTWL